jgi:hypothetical protein
MFGHVIFGSGVAIDVDIVYALDLDIYSPTATTGVQVTRSLFDGDHIILNRHSASALDAEKQQEDLQRCGQTPSLPSSCIQQAEARVTARTIFDLLTAVFRRWIQPPAATVQKGVEAMLGFLRRIWGSATTLDLDLSFTGSTYFPPELFEKRFSRLTSLNLAHCDLQELPVGITMFTCLKSMTLSYNTRLESLPIQ